MSYDAVPVVRFSVVFTTSGCLETEIYNRLTTKSQPNMLLHTRKCQKKNPKISQKTSDAGIYEVI